MAGRVLTARSTSMSLQNQFGALTAKLGFQKKQRRGFAPCPAVVGEGASRPRFVTGQNQSSSVARHRPTAASALMDPALPATLLALTSNKETLLRELKNGNARHNKSHKKNQRILVSCQTLWLGLGVSGAVARLGGTGGVPRAAFRDLIHRSASHSNGKLSRRHELPVRGADRGVLAQGRTASLALGSS